MTVSTQVQDLINQVAKNTSIEQSADLALKAMAVQIAELGTQIASLQLQLANGGALHPDDITALSKAQQDLAATAATLQTDIPQNIVTNPGAPPSTLAATTTTLTSPTNPSTAGTPITLTAVVRQTTPNVGAAPVTPTGTVQFMDGTTNIGSGQLDASGQTTLSVPFSLVTPPVIGHVLTAVYGGDSVNNGSTSGAVTQLVSAVPGASPVVGAVSATTTAPFVATPMTSTTPTPTPTLLGISTGSPS